LTFALYPFIVVSELLTRLLTKSGHRPPSFSREEFTAMADIGAAKGQLNPKESRILRNLFRFPSLTVHDIMTPRTVLFALQQDLTVDEVLHDEQSISNFSRIPIYAQDRDDITGFVLKDELLLQEYRSDGKAKLSDLKRDLPHVTDATPLTEALEMLLNNRQHLLLVVDSYGGTEGIVTLEDVVETLIGSEIVDEMDEIDDMRALAREKWEERMVDAGIDINIPRDAEGGSNAEASADPSRPGPSSAADAGPTDAEQPDGRKSDNSLSNDGTAPE
jgi:CBS domain containing-hemolysin-like protein